MWGTNSVDGLYLFSAVLQTELIMSAYRRFGVGRLLYPFNFKKFTTMRFFLSTTVRSREEANVYSDIAPDLERFGDRVSGDLLKLHHECEKNPPVLEQFNGWGERVDNIRMCDAWNKMKAVSAEEGLVAIAYEGKYGEHRHVVKSNNALFPKSLSGPAPIKLAFKHLTSRNPNEFWTSGQWMTERKGGSDVASGTETLAIPQSDGSYKLYGYKWFTSATDSDVAVTLARIVDHNGISIDNAFFKVISFMLVNKNIVNAVINVVAEITTCTCFLMYGYLCSVYIYIYIYIYIYVCMSIYIYIYIYFYLFILTYTHTLD
ncbi:hypothetical protein LSH36_2g02030 [Paralvinella palmiformis]|uniref:Uncharacterized protein n=1 Tax=Paralvinella palmiformis TaxID=53620 RepID=A0AAD9KGU6_9ANNE|nr:hypothetical protein LSH36_2g02030 [Paralvinella palmiformis]